MPRMRHLDGSDAAPFMTLQLDCWPDELSPAQLAAYTTAEKEHNDIRNKLNEIVTASGGENIFLGEIFSAYQVPGLAPGLEKISKPVVATRKEHKKVVEEKKPKTEVTRKREAKNIEIVDDDDDDDYLPLKRPAKPKVVEKEKKKEVAEKKTITRGKTTITTIANSPPTVPNTFRPTENTSIGGLSVGENLKKKDVVDLTKEESNNKVVADSREISFNKLQGKTFPSLVVVARPSLKVKENVNDRSTLDAKVKGVLMHTATKFTEWLIQQGLVRSEQGCQIHSGTNLKLGMYSDASKFPYSGGYVWISECCPTRFVSVFSGSLFEGAPHPPSVLLKLIYHWSCQTNVQNVVQWVKVDNLYVKGLYTWLRSVCTVALHQHMNLLGGSGKKIEVGVISLGTTSQDGQQRQVKVEVLGVLDAEAKIVRLRAVEPLNDGERNYKKRFSKILEPLTSWVHKDSQIHTDLTVDKGTLFSMGYKFVVQTTSEGKGKNCNANIMDYLRRIVPRMFQNTLSLLSRQIIQQFLDELVWREWYGTTPGLAFDNIVSHISEQTRLDAKDTLVLRLNKVSTNPFRNWAHLSVKAPAKALKDDFFAPSTSTAAVPSTPVPTPAPAPAPSTSGKRGRYKKRESSPDYIPYKKIAIKEEPKRYSEKKIVPPKTYQEEYKKVEPTIYLEQYYYGLLNQEQANDSAIPVVFKAQCPECHKTLSTNTSLMNHLKQHANPTDETSVQCSYCLENWADKDKLTKHHVLAHPIETKNALSHGGVECIICESRFSTNNVLANHMQKIHVAADLPYKCGCCDFASSVIRHTIDHFYINHADSGMLQCPFCLQIFAAANKIGTVIPHNICEYLEHVKFHMIKSQCRKCNRCVLAFVNRGALKVHQMYAHVSQQHKQKLIETVCKNITKIPKPKHKSSAHKEILVYFKKYHNVSLLVDNGHLCLECGVDFEEHSHFCGFMKCPKCKYHTCCLRTMMEHASICIGATNLETAAVSTLDMEMHCICGFSSTEGNALARHLATCERRSAYPSAESVQENTVKRNMLDMLGLVRRDEDEESDDFLLPADNQTIPVIETEDEPTHTNEDPVETTDQQFNTQLSLDDLAPASVAPQSETDRTPQLRDEYQPLATPRVAPADIMLEHSEFETA